MDEETNRFDEQFLNKSALKPINRAHQWAPANQTEMKRFIGLMLLMGIMKKPKIEDYWSTDILISTPVFNATMPHDQFQLLLK